MNKSNSLLYIFVVIVSLSGCNRDKHPLLPIVSGTPGQVALVVNDAEWNTEVGEEFKRIFSHSYDVLPQYEPIFDVLHLTQKGFDNVFKSQRNIVITEISPSYKKSRLLAQKDIWAKPQIVITLYGANDDSIVSLLTNYDYKIIDLLNEMEIKRLTDVYRKNQDNSVVQKIRKDHNLSLIVPDGYKLEVDSPDFVWLSFEEGDIEQGILIYHYNYTDTNTFTQDYLISKRDKFLKKYVRGTVEGSYITTEKEFKPEFSEYSFKGQRYVAELRGLWKMENGISMGGPFVSITTLDEKRNRIITIEGLVFAAGHNKRNYMRQVESIIYSFDLIY